MSLANQSIFRVYRCDNNKCEAEIAYKETVGDPWRSKCPFCNKKSLYLDKAVLSLSCIVGLTQPKTLGSWGEKNYAEAKKQGKFQSEKEEKKPWWRKSKKVNYNVLKDPKKYINTGNV